MSDPNKKKAVIYCRVSTKEQVDEGNSLSTQEKICKEYALKNGYDVVELFIERGESAKTQNRTEWQKLLHFCADRKNKISAVIAYKIDRIARHSDDYSQIRVLLKRYGVEIKSTTEFFENNPAGRFMENIIANVAQFDNDVRAERCSGGMKDAVREGRYVWSAPLGYSNVRIGGKATIAPNEKAAIVRKAFEEVAKNQQPTEEIRRMLVPEGLVNAKGKPYSRAHFYNLLANELYTGWIIKFGERHRGLFDAIISEEQFAQVQRVLKRKSHKSLIYQKENPDFPLRRFVLHPTGAKITGHWSKGKMKKYPYYRFLGINGTETRKETLEDSFKAFLNEFRLDPKHLKALRHALEYHFGSATKKEAQEVERLKSTIAHLKEKQTALVQKNLEGVISNDVLRQQLDLVDESLLNANSQLLRLPDKHENLAELFDLVETYLINPAEAWQKLPFETKLKLQVFEFPLGVVFNGKKFRTPQIASIYKDKAVFLRALSTNVDSTRKTTNTSFITLCLHSAYKEIRDLASIIRETSKAS